MNSKHGLILVLLFQSYFVLSQSLQSRHLNFTDFSTHAFEAHPDLLEFTNKQYVSHPDFGLKPYKTPCDDCVELIQFRSAFERYFIKKNTSGNHYFKQQSYFPLHFLDTKGNWLSIEPQLRKLNTNLFGAPQQPIQTFFTSIDQLVYLKAGQASIILNKNCTVSEWNKDHGSDKKMIAVKCKYSAGDDGVFVENVFENIDVQHQFKIGSIKTNYIIKSRPAFKNENAYFLLEENIQTNVPVQIKLDSSGAYFDSLGHFIGSFSLFCSDTPLLKWNASYVQDQRNMVLGSFYNIVHVDSYSFTLQTFIPAWFLKDTSTRYPVVLDPWVTGYNKLGNFSASGTTLGNLSFTYHLRGSCNYSLAVTVPGQSDIINAKVDLEYETTFSPSCGTPSLPLPGCKKLDLSEEVISDECGTTSGILTCSPPPGSIDTPGTCTTDPRLVPGASAITIPGMLDCIPPQCPDYVLHFTLKNREYKCGDSCGQTCATGHMWAMTIEARKLEGFILPNKVKVCAGEPVVLTAYPTWGVPPYRYRWSTGDTTKTITINPTATLYVSCRIFDTCGVFVDDDTLIEVTPSPAADAGTDKVLCEGGNTGIGGSPTGDIVNAFLWTSIPSSATSFLTSTTQPNPAVDIPLGSIDTFIYIVRVTDIRCFRHDTMRVYSVRNPSVKVFPDAIVSVCTGEEVQISTTKPFQTYLWSTGSTSPSIFVSSPGTYFTQVTDSLGCAGSSDSVEIIVKQPLPVLAFPDTTLDPEENARLYTDLNLSTVDSFYWTPPLYLNCTNCENPVSTPEEDMVYYLYVLDDGCWVMDSLIIKLNYPFDYFVPNAFSPNGDGVNDDFYPILPKVLRIDSFMIFDRWGEKVWDSLSPWNGDYKGTKLGPDVFIYYVEVSFQGQKKWSTGSVTLIR